ncbi:MAG: guanine deaminase [Candidatus Cloacimonetes bacterium]|nr:guanine deaminase [Candidatus Cloacimonadota bacterium]
MLIIKTNILNPISSDKVEFLPDTFISISDTKIESISKNIENRDFTDYSDSVCIPGLIDTHVHLSQYYVRGRHNSNLFDWLDNCTFPEELKSKDPQYAKKVAKDFFKASVKAGTTTSVIYTSPFKEACDIAFETAEKLGVRAIIGKTMMDTNSPEYLQEDTETSFRESVELFEKWNKKTELLEYVFSPRFAPVCSSQLMKMIGEFAQKNEAYIQTHLSENQDEIELVKKLFPKYKNYTEIYEKLGILGPKTLLGHGIHLDNEELEIIKNTESKIIHCPDSNFFLKSGVFPFEKIKKSGIDFALASDAAGGTSISMFNVMKMTCYRQDDYTVSPEEAFYYATLGGAKVLGKEDIIGSIEVGKDADIVFLKIPEQNKYNCSELLSKLIYVNEEVEIISTLVAGRKVF